MTIPSRTKCDVVLYSGIVRAANSATSMTREDALDEPLHVLLVGTGPVDPIAGGADTKIVVRLSRPWRQPVLDGFFGDRLQQSVTSQASLKRSGQVEQIEPPENLNQLCSRLRGPHKVPPNHLSPL